MNSVYGPVPSWRLGRSIGIDPICSGSKICSFDCCYCQLGSTVHKTAEQQNFLSIAKLKDDLHDFGSMDNADAVTLSGTGEPTLAGNLGEIVDVLREHTRLPIAVLTNSTFLNDDNVRKILRKTDIVVAKLDAPDSRLMRMINSPAEGCGFDEVLEGIRSFRRVFKGRLALQMMFIEMNKGLGWEMANIAQEIGPDEVQINTPLRPCRVGHLDIEQLGSIKKHFEGQNVISVYDRGKPFVEAGDKNEILRRRGIVES